MISSVNYFTKCLLDVTIYVASQINWVNMIVYQT